MSQPSQTAADPASITTARLQARAGGRRLIQTEPRLRAWSAERRPPDSRHIRFPAGHTARDLAGKPAAAEVAEP